MAHRILLIAILVLYALLAVAYSFATPLWEAPDEPSHYLYAEYVANQWSLPPQAPPQRGHFFEHGYVTSLYEWHQPPLYYILLASQIAVANILESKVTPYTFPEVNPAFAEGAVNLFYPATALATGPRVARLFSVFLGLLTLLVTYRLALTVSADDNAIALTATGFMAFIPQFTFLTSYVTNDNLANLIATLCILAYIDIINKTKALSDRQIISIGLLITLALLTKLSLLFVLPLGLLAALWRLTKHHSPKIWFRESTLFVGIALSLPILGLLLIPGFEDRLIYAIRSLQPKPDFFSLQYISTLWPMTSQSFWGRFGWMNVRTPMWITKVMNWIALVGLIGSLVLMVRGGIRQKKASLLRQSLVFLWIVWGLVLIGFIRFNLSIFQPQGRLLFPALSSIVILVSLGLMSFASHRYYRIIVGLSLVSIALCINLVSFLGVLLPAYGKNMY